VGSFKGILHHSPAGLAAWSSRAGSPATGRNSPTATRPRRIWSTSSVSRWAGPVVSWGRARERLKPLAHRVAPNETRTKSSSARANAQLTAARTRARWI